MGKNPNALNKICLYQNGQVLAKIKQSKILDFVNNILLSRHRLIKLLTLLSYSTAIQKVLFVCVLHFSNTQLLQKQRHLKFL